MNPTTLRAIQLPSNVHAKPILDITDKLPKARESWEVALLNRRDGAKRRGLRAFEDITRIALHHDAVVNGTAEGHAKYHIRNGDYGIAYHIFIKNDQIYQVNDLLALTWHTASNNYDTIGICLAGNFSTRPMTQIERDTLYAAILTVLKIFPNIREIKGHKEFKLPKPTACPGTMFDMERVRRDIAYQQSEAYNTAVATETYAKFTFAWNLWRDVNNPDRAKLAKLFKKTEVTMKEDGLW